jgi:hypothetical protein
MASLSMTNLSTLRPTTFSTISRTRAPLRVCCAIEDLPVTNTPVVKLESGLRQRGATRMIRTTQADASSSAKTTSAVDKSIYSAEVNSTIERFASRTRTSRRTARHTSRTPNVTLAACIRYAMVSSSTLTLPRGSHRH